ncbi:SMC family ATPase [Paenibacillus sp. P26]|nr:SMC family ATPase [Paenibacillus sp. P26]
MRPLKLVMTAFGPYRERETIDFTELEDRRLFVISGNTGAGKTSIFDAVCFALYGGASGEDRFEARMLRSHFADEETHTSVEFEFAVGRRSFRVFRRLGHRKGGNKSETGARIELFETTGGQETPCVDRFTVSDVNAKLESLIGLSKDQFSQIVMLPQGEFRKPLTSDTENKEDILRRIFRTGLYQKLEDRFQQKSRELKDALKAAQLESEVYIKQVEAALPRGRATRCRRPCSRNTAACRRWPKGSSRSGSITCSRRRRPESGALWSARSPKRRKRSCGPLRHSLRASRSASRSGSSARRWSAGDRSWPRRRSGCSWRSGRRGSRRTRSAQPGGAGREAEARAARSEAAGARKRPQARSRWRRRGTARRRRASRSGRPPSASCSGSASSSRPCARWRRSAASWSGCSRRSAPAPGGSPLRRRSSHRRARRGRPLRSGRRRSSARRRRRRRSRRCSSGCGGRCAC